MELKWDHDHSILQVSGSLYGYFGMDRGHGSDPELDALLAEEKPRCVIILLIDAMGTSILEKHLPENGFFRSHILKSVSTVFPPTTTAATVSFLSGKSPAENGWLGWNQYFREENDNIILFLNRSKYGKRSYGPGWSDERLPMERIYDALNDAGIPAESVWPGWAPHHPCRTFPALLGKAKELADENRFIYAYWDQLDDLMHKKGTGAEEVREMLEAYEKETAGFAAELPEDTLLIVIADHSQIDVRCTDISADEELCACLAAPPALEPRTCAFYVKSGKEAEFEDLFRKKYGHEFLLLRHDEVIRSGIFGQGKPAERFAEFIGDYTAFAVSDLELDYMASHINRGNHAGLVPEERYVPVIAVKGSSDSKKEV